MTTYTNMSTYYTTMFPSLTYSDMFTHYTTMFHSLDDIPVFKRKLKNRTTADDVDDFIHNRDFNQYKKMIMVNHIKMKRSVKNDIKNSRTLDAIKEVIEASNIFSWINPSLGNIRNIHNFTIKYNDIVSTFFKIVINFDGNKILIDFIPRTTAVIPIKKSRLSLGFDDVNRNMFARLKIER